MTLPRALHLAALTLAIALLVALPLFAGHLLSWEALACSLIVALCVGLGCAAAALGEPLRAPWRAADWALAAFIALMIVASARSVYLHASIVQTLQMAGYVAFVMLWRGLGSHGRERQWGWIAVAAGGAIAGFYGLQDWVHTAIFQGDLSWRAFGTFYNPNCLAGYVLVVLPAALVALALAWRATTDPDRPPRPRLELIFAGFAALIPALTLLLTASRAGMLGAMLGAVVFVTAAPTRVRARWLVVAALVLVVLVAVAPPLRNRMLQFTTQSNSALFRWYTWQGTAAMVAARPLTGFGPGTFQDAYQSYARAGFTRMAHQTPLQVAAEAGLPTLVALLLALALIVRELVTGLRAGGLRAVQCAAGLAALAALGFQNLADYTWYIPAVGLTLAAVLGLALSAAAGDGETDEPPVAEPPPRARALCWVAVAVCALVIAGAGVGLRAQALAANGRDALARGGYVVARAWLARATRVDHGRRLARVPARPPAGPGRRQAHAGPAGGRGVGRHAPRNDVVPQQGPHGHGVGRRRPPVVFRRRLRHRRGRRGGL